MAKYKLSVIIPSWNASQYIGAMLESILDNTFQDYQVFVVDDQSKDESVKVIQKYCEKDQRIKLVVRDREPKGAQTCRNMGLELSGDAEYLIWLDADDVIAPYCFEQRVAYMDNHPEIDFAIFPAKSFEKDLWDDISFHNSYGVPIGDDALKAMLNRTLPMVGWTNIYRNSSIKAVDLIWDIRLLSMQDSDFNIACLIKGLKHGYAYEEGAKVDYFYRCSPSNSSSIASKIGSIEHYHSHLYLINKIIDSLSDEQKRRYKTDIKCYLFLFSTIFSNDKRTYKEFLKIPYIKSRPRLLVGFYLYQFIRGRYRLASIVMLSRIPLLVLKRGNEWEKQMAYNKQEMIKNR